jgi:hypothetical protein
VFRKLGASIVKGQESNIIASQNSFDDLKMHVNSKAVKGDSTLNH